MASAKTSTIKGRDVKPGQVVKVRGRWVRIARWADPDWDRRGFRLALVAAHNHDPRLATDSPSGRSVTGRYRMLWAEDDYLTREQPAPVWEWVTRNRDREDGITTPCAVCAAQARLKPGSFFAARGLDWPVTEVADRRVHKACASEAEHLAAAVTELEIDAAGVGRWTTSGQCLPDDTAAIMARLGLAPGLDLAATAAARDAETAEFLDEYRLRQPATASPEEVAELTAAFGPGQVVVDAISGRKTRT